MAACRWCSAVLYYIEYSIGSDRLEPCALQMVSPNKRLTFRPLDMVSALKGLHPLKHLPSMSLLAGLTYPIAELSLPAGGRCKARASCLVALNVPLPRARSGLTSPPSSGCWPGLPRRLPYLRTPSLPRKAATLRPAQVQSRADAGQPHTVHNTLCNGITFEGFEVTIAPLLAMPCLCLCKVGAGSRHSVHRCSSTVCGKSVPGATWRLGTATRCVSKRTPQHPRVQSLVGIAPG